MPRSPRRARYHRGIDPAMHWSFKEMVRDALSRVPEISCEELAKRLGEGVVLDVREADETRACILPDAVLLPRGVVEQNVHEHAPSKDGPVFVYSATGGRSALVADVMHRMGYRHVHSVA